MKKNEKRNISVDMNIIQVLYRLMGTDKKAIERVENSYTKKEIDKIKMLIASLDMYKIHITPQVERELEAAEATRFPGIVQFARKTLGIAKPKDYSKSKLLSEHIRCLQEEYLKKDVLLRDTTKDPQSAVRTEIKDGKEDSADSLIIAENAILYGYPLFTLNDKHLVSMNEADNKHRPYRSQAILAKNKKYLRKVPADKAVVRKNLRSQHATTYSVSKLFEEELYR